MLMHTKGILVMTPDSAMVLTGKQSLDFSGGVSAEDNFGIGGYDRVMGPNGQAQYWAPEPAGRARRADGALRPHLRRAGRDARRGGRPPPTRPTATSPTTRTRIAGSDFTTVGEIFSAEHNPDRKKPFDIRTVMRALSDQDHPVLERWAGMADADTAVVQDVHLGGWPVCLIGIESQLGAAARLPAHRRPGHLHRGHAVPAVVEEDRAGDQRRRPATGRWSCWRTCPGFDGSPESMRKLQLEYGAEIGRAIVNFDGPIVFCVISRYHGGAFVVFSKALNPNMTVLALEGSFASVLGGAPAAAVVFSGEVSNRTATDPRVTALQARLAEPSGAERAALNARAGRGPGRRSGPRSSARWPPSSTGVHSIQRAVEVGSVDAIISAAELRPRDHRGDRARPGGLASYLRPRFQRGWIVGRSPGLPAIHYVRRPGVVR